MGVGVARLMVPFQQALQIARRRPSVGQALRRCPNIIEQQGLDQEILRQEEVLVAPQSSSARPRGLLCHWNANAPLQQVAEKQTQATAPEDPGGAVQRHLVVLSIERPTPCKDRSVQEDSSEGHDHQRA